MLSQSKPRSSLRLVVHEHRKYFESSGNVAQCNEHVKKEEKDVM